MSFRAITLPKYCETFAHFEQTASRVGTSASLHGAGADEAVDQDRDHEHRAQDGLVPSGSTPAKTMPWRTMPKISAPKTAPIAEP